MDQDKKQEPPRCACNFSAEQVAEALVQKIKDPKTAQEIMDVWGGRVDQQLGRGIRRVGWYLMLTFMGVGAVKLGLVEKLLTK